MGARAFALFIKPQKTWTPPPLDEQEASVFRELLKVSKIFLSKGLTTGLMLQVLDIIIALFITRDC